MKLIARAKSDWIYLTGLLRIVGHMNRIARETTTLVGDEVEAMTDAHGPRDFIVFEGETWTYADLEKRANRFANWGLSIGLKPGDAVALFMENRPDYIAFWVGMAKIAVRTALINSNLQGAGLAHCVKAASARALVMNAEVAPAYASAKDLMTLDLGAWSLGGAANAAELETRLASVSDARPDTAIRAGITSEEIAFFIYTSGTTGLPKAAKITNFRARGLMRAFVDAVGVNSSDRLLATLPLYHATGGMCAVGCALNTGAVLILKKKFSASSFWQDAIEGRATMLVYIGELGRYLMNLPPAPAERRHAIVKGFGNGLRADVWAEFVKRTGISRLVEFYGSTEGNVNFFNLDGTVGAVGRVPPLLKTWIKARIVRFDVDTEQPVRGPDGFCIEAAADEPGEAIGPITRAVRDKFDGYNDAAQTSKKILRDVFVKGDMWFRTGDLMREDADGYIFFVDRVGDTYRWKSENVSTGEVEIALSGLNWVDHAVVYGVPAPGQEGKAGMAAITAKGAPDMQQLYAHMARSLPAYARPVFLRFQHEVETTGTLKYRKVDLVADGFDPARTTDKLYVINSEAETYAPLDGELYQRIVAGRVRL